MTRTNNIGRRTASILLAVVIALTGVLPAYMMTQTETANAASKKASVNRAKIIKTARSKLGKRYVWGASGPNSFDCSGYVYWVMKHSKVKGVKIKRYTAQGIYNAKRRYNIGRSIKKAKRGDIVLFGRNKSKHRIYHAAIYYGKGKVIHASTGWTGRKCVKITKADTRHIAAIIRMPALR